MICFYVWCNFLKTIGAKMVFFTAIVKEQIVFGNAIFKKGSTVFFARNEDGLFIMAKSVIVPFNEEIESKIIPIKDDRANKFLYNPKANRIANDMYKKLRRKDEWEEKQGGQEVKQDKELPVHIERSET